MEVIANEGLDDDVVPLEKGVLPLLEDSFIIAQLLLFVGKREEMFLFFSSDCLTFQPTHPVWDATEDSFIIAQLLLFVRKMRKSFYFFFVRLFNLRQGVRQMHQNANCPAEAVFQDSRGTS